MRNGLIIAGVLSVAAAAFFLVVASRAGTDESIPPPQLSTIRAMESHATYAVVYEIKRTFGERHESARETVIRLGADRYRGESTDSTGYTIIVIEREDARYQCESSDEIEPQCYRTDLREPRPDLNLEFLGTIPRSPSIEDAGRDRREIQTVGREIAGELGTCFRGASPELRSEWCYSPDGIPLYNQSDFILAGQRFVMTREAVSVDRHPESIGLEPPYPLVAPPSLDTIAISPF